MLERYTRASSWRSRILSSLVVRKKGGKKKGNGDSRARKGRNKIPRSVGRVGRVGRSVGSVGRSVKSVGWVALSVARPRRVGRSVVSGRSVGLVGRSGRPVGWSVGLVRWICRSFASGRSVGSGRSGWSVDRSGVPVGRVDRSLGRPVGSVGLVGRSDRLICF